jgi:hypothetical protein
MGEVPLAGCSEEMEQTTRPSKNSEIEMGGKTPAVSQQKLDYSLPGLETRLLELRKNGLILRRNEHRSPKNVSAILS